ncbi:hypothetical protein QO002_002440 [Pararhizobium capsulatum DSM 1112]|uniref:Uncharacterized protein n=1 Tax=Pararhizobium capsulatum DSM 1112 TaxID=1121113 RepID=A0ABU0BTX1_9HYPH|nr:hypothetical protein [Pararhizobium capsulatum]MDQ0320302.1 hypothetical protein [Pararhizobium capsulatum DSM 1112]
MSDIRALIRDVLAEEIAAIRAELLGAAGSREERVRVDDARGLTEFALSVLRRAADPGFAAALQEGRLIFVPAGAPTLAAAGPAMPMAAYAPASPSVPVSSPPLSSLPLSQAQPVQQQASVLVTTVPSAVPQVTKSLITERDITGLGSDTTRLRIGRQSRLTPLAADEARRRGIRIERSAT